MAKENNTNYLRVVAQDGSDSVDLYLYGYIGQDYTWSEARKDETITDSYVVKKINELSAKYQRINVRINSPGGSVYHGAPILSALLSCKAEVHTYIDGLAASMASYLWMAGQVRHMSKHSKLMIHATSSSCYGTALDMMETAEQLNKFDDQFIEAIAELTAMDEEEVRKTYFDYRDHWVTASEAVELGLIEAVDDYKSTRVQEDVESMSYAELIQAFAHPESDPSPQPLSVFAQLKQTIINRAKRFAAVAEPSNTNTIDMKLEDFQQSLGNELDPEAVATALREQGYEVTKDTPPAAATEEDTPDLADQLRAAVEQVVAPLQDKINTLQAQVKAYGDLPGAAPSDTASGQDGHDGIDTGTQEIDAIKTLADAANKGERVDVTA